MKQIHSAFFALMFSIVLLAGCAQIGLQPETPTTKLDGVFNQVLAHVMSHDYVTAYDTALLGKKEFLASGEALPEKYRALLRVTAQKGIEESIVMLRVQYYAGRFEQAARIAAAVMWVAKTEGVEIPEEGKDFIRKLEAGMQELYLLNFNFNTRRLEI